MTKRVPKVGDWVRWVKSNNPVGIFMYVTAVGKTKFLATYYLQDINEIAYDIDGGWIFRDEVERPTKAEKPGDVFWKDGKKFVAMSPSAYSMGICNGVRWCGISPHAYGSDPKRMNETWPALDGNGNPILVAVPVEEGGE